MEKIKQFMRNTVETEKGKDILVILIVILVGLASFELGRLSKAGESSTGVKVEYASQEASAISALESEENNSVQNKIKTTAASPDGKNFFASSRGSKYYSLGCSGGKNIKQENRVYFKTSTEAEAAGYELSSSCK